MHPTSTEVTVSSSRLQLFGLQQPSPQDTAAPCARPSHVFLFLTSCYIPRSLCFSLHIILQAGNPSLPKFILPTLLPAHFVLSAPKSAVPLTPCIPPGNAGPHVVSGTADHGSWKLPLHAGTHQRMSAALQ